MVHFVGAGSGAVDLITLRGYRLLEKADVIIYAGSLVNAELLEYKKETCIVYNSAKMSLEEIIEVIKKAEKEDKVTVRLHTGDPSIFGAIDEQFQALDSHNIDYDVCPGVSSLFGAASSLKMEYTLPGVSQSLIITRLEGRTPVPEMEKIELLAAHKATMVIFLSTGMLKELSENLIKGGYDPKTSAAIVYKATWSDEKKVICTIDTLEEVAKAKGIYKTALIVVGDVLNKKGNRSMLYHPEFTTEFRKGLE